MEIHLFKLLRIFKKNIDTYFWKGWRTGLWYLNNVKVGGQYTKKNAKAWCSVLHFYFHGLCSAKSKESQKLSCKTEPEVHAKIVLFIMSSSNFCLTLSHCVSAVLPGKDSRRSHGIDRQVPIEQIHTKKQACLTEIII